MNGEIPSVPITTLAGISSLTDLLPEMPLPSPLPQTLSNKSLLFHPRVAEEAQILLSLRDEALVPQLIQSLAQTSSDHIELKDHYAGTELPIDQQQNVPNLLKAILQRNPSVFKGPRANSPRQPQWNQAGGLTNSNHTQASPASYGPTSPPTYLSPSGSRHLPQDSPAQLASARVPALPIVTCASLDPPVVKNTQPVVVEQPNPVAQRVSVITEQSKVLGTQVSQNGSAIGQQFFNACSQESVSDLASVARLNCTANRSEDLFNDDLLPLLKDERSSVSRDSGVGSGLSSSTASSSLSNTLNLSIPETSTLDELQLVTSIPRTQTTQMAGSSPAQASVAPPPPPTKEETKPNDKKVAAVAVAKTRLKEPVVRLNRLSLEDQALMQRSISAFAEKSPTLASQLGITPNHRISSTDNTLRDSESESDHESKTRSPSKYFKAREKERDVQRQKVKEQRKKVTNEDEDYFPDNTCDYGSSLSERIKKRKRSLANHRSSDDIFDCGSSDAETFVPKPKLRKVERKFVPVLEKLSPEELMETNTYQRFSRSIDLVFENTEDVDLTADLDDEGDIPPEAMIPKYQLQDLCSEAAKLKTLGAMDSIPSDRIVRLLNILEKNIRDGTRISPLGDPDDDEDESKLWLELTMERVMRAVDASLTAVYIMTSPNMPKRTYLEDVIDRIVQFTMYQLQNTIYPSFDPVYRVDSKGKGGGTARKKRAHAKEVREKSILTLYNKLHELVGLLAELLSIQVLTDTAVLHASSMGVAPFFVENVNELQLSALKLVTTIFTKYDKHRRLLLDDILASIARLPSSKRSLRSYRLNSEEHIQMLTALVLQLIQCVVVLPESLADNKTKSKAKEDKEEGHNDKGAGSVDRDVLIISKYETATRTAANFLTVFLNKCGSKGDEVDYRPLFENFVQDLLTTVNKPEWPATELLLSLLGKLLVTNFVNKGVEMSLRVTSLDNLGLVAARLRKDAVSSQKKLNTIDQIIKDIKAEEEKDDEFKKRPSKYKADDLELDPEEERTQFLQRVLLDYLAVNVGNMANTYARHFYLAQWYRDATIDRRHPTKRTPSKHSRRNNKKNKKKRKGDTSDEESSNASEVEDEEDSVLHKDHQDTELMKLNEHRKAFLVKKIKPFDCRHDMGTAQVIQTYIDYESAELISRYLASKRSFSQSFDVYLKQILCVLTETSIQIRTKALKCLTMVVEADPSVLARVDMQSGVRHSFLDHSTSVREAAVDLVGKFVLSRPELLHKYYDMLSTRILDTGVSVRKRVIKILKDICIECPDFPKIPEICVKMIRRVNDEEGIRKLVMEVFQNMWFTPVHDRGYTTVQQRIPDSKALLRKVMNITDVVAASKDMGLDWFETLLLSLFKPKEDKDDSTKVMVEPPKALLLACKQIVDCLIENLIELEEKSYSREENVSRGSSQRLVACLQTLFLFAKIRPQLLVRHASTLQPYLSLKCQTQGDYQIISSVARTLELVVPLIDFPSETFLAQLEEDSVKLILQHDQTVVASCLSCLGSVVNNVTRNFKLIRDCFTKYYGHLTSYKIMYEQDPKDPNLAKFRPFFRRALFTVGLLLRYFDFTDKDVILGLPVDIKDQVFETLTYFIHQPNSDIQTFTLKAMGSLCIRHYEFMLGIELKTLYHRLLTNEDAPLLMRIQVLNNIEMYLQEEEMRMIKQDQEWAKLSKSENLKEMGDVSSGMASTVIQLYLKEILNAFLHANIGVRHAALKVIQLILQQGLVHIVQIVPYLICMSTDSEQIISNSADKQLQDIEKKYPGFIHMKSQSGIRLSFQLQQILQADGEINGVTRGFRVREGEHPGALNGFLYSILRSTKQQRRALALSILKQFDEQVKTSLYQMLYLSDNLAYFPYQVMDEPLFIIHHIDIMISVSGTNLLQGFKEALIPSTSEARLNPTTGAAEPIYLEEDEDEDESVLLSRVPEDTMVLQECMTASQGCLLLLVLKQHLKDLYGISDAKINQYSPSESAKIYEKAVNRKSHSRFEPKATIQKLKQGAPPSVLDEAARKALIDQYLDFKQLMLKFDPDDPDDEDREGVVKAVATKMGEEVTHSVETAPGQVQPLAEHMDTPQKIPKLTIVPPKPPEVKDSKHHKSHKTHKSDRHRRHRHKKKRKKFASDEDSENEFSDPDFLV